MYTAENCLEGLTPNEEDCVVRFQVMWKQIGIYHCVFHNL